MPKRDAVAMTIAVVTVVVSGVVAVRAQTAPGELACEWFGLGHGEPTRTHPTAVDAAIAWATSLHETRRKPIPTGPGWVIDVTGADIQVGEIPPNGRAFAVRDHGRTEALLFVIRQGGGWVVGRDYSC